MLRQREEVKPGKHSQEHPSQHFFKPAMSKTKGSACISGQSNVSKGNHMELVGQMVAICLHLKKQTQNSFLGGSKPLTGPEGAMELLLQGRQ